MSANGVFFITSFSNSVIISRDKIRPSYRSFSVCNSKQINWQQPFIFVSYIYNSIKLINSVIAYLQSLQLDFFMMKSDDIEDVQIFRLHKVYSL